MSRSLSLDVRIATLVDDVGELKEELQLALSTLRSANNPTGVELGTYRIALLLFRRVLNDAELKWSESVLDDGLKKLNEAGQIPPEVWSSMHTVRTWSNKAKHASEKAQFTVSEAEHHLDALVNAASWYYCQFEKGPKLARIYAAQAGELSGSDSALLFPGGGDAGADERFVGAWPLFLGEWVGRGEQLEEISRELSEQNTLVLMGGPGIGKTRLVAEYANRFGERYADGLYFANMASLPARSGERSVELYLGALFSGRIGESALLALDNCEHMSADLAVKIAQFSRAHPKLHILCTSRGPMHMLRGQIVHALPVPDEIEDNCLIDYDELSIIESNPSVDLFSRRTRLCDPTFEVNEENAAKIVAVCRRLGGIPFVIELVAAKMQLGLSCIGDALDNWSDDAAGGDYTLTDVRHNSVDACVQWSIDLLDSMNARRLLYGAAIFEGAFSAAAYHAAVLDAPATPVSERAWMSDIAALMKQGLVVKGWNSSTFALPGPVRLFAYGKLQQEPDYEQIQRSYEKWLESGHALATAHLVGAQAYDTINFAAENSAGAIGLADRLDHGDDVYRAAEVRYKRAFYLLVSGKLLQSSRLLTQALPHLLKPEHSSEAFLGLGTAHYLKCEFDEALVYVRRAIDLASQVSDAREGVLALATSSHGILEAFVNGPSLAASEILEQAIRLSNETGDTWTIAYAYLSKATYHWHAYDYEESMRYYRTALAGFDKAKDHLLCVFALNSLGHLARLAGRYGEAADFYLRSMNCCTGILFERGRAGCVLGTSGMALPLGRDDEAAFFWGCATRHYNRMGVKMIPPIEREYVHNFEFHRAAMESRRPGAFAAQLDKGKALSLAQGFQLAKEFMRQVRQSEKSSSSGGAPPLPSKI